MTEEEFAAALARQGKPATLPALLAKPVPKAPKRGVMNRTEREYSLYLEARRRAGECHYWQFEAFKFQLAADTTLTPDFVVVTPTGIEIHEVKGGHVWEDSWVKFKIAASLFPWARWFWCQKGPGGWTITERNAP